MRPASLLAVLGLASFGLSTTAIPPLCAAEEETPLSYLATVCSAMTAQFSRGEYHYRYYSEYSPKIDELHKLEAKKDTSVWYGPWGPGEVVWKSDGAATSVNYVYRDIAFGKPETIRHIDSVWDGSTTTVHDVEKKTVQVHVGRNIRPYEPLIMSGLRLWNGNREALLSEILRQPDVRIEPSSMVELLKAPEIKITWTPKNLPARVVWLNREMNYAPTRVQTLVEDGKVFQELNVTWGTPKNGVPTLLKSVSTIFPEVNDRDGWYREVFEVTSHDDAVGPIRIPKLVEFPPGTLVDNMVTGETFRLLPAK
jgi:hypothetical protein